MMTIITPTIVTTAIVTIVMIAADAGMNANVADVSSDANIVGTSRRRAQQA